MQGPCCTDSDSAERTTCTMCTTLVSCTVSVQTDPMSTQATLSVRVADEINAMLGRRRMAKSELARKLGVSHTWVTNRLAGTTPIDLNDLDRIARAIGVPVQSLLPNDPGSRVLTNAGSPASTVRRTADVPHSVDVRSPRGSVASTIRRPRRRSAHATGTPLMAAAGMVLR